MARAKSTGTAESTGKTGKAGKAGANGTTPKTIGSPLIPESQIGSAPDEFQDIFGERLDGWWALVPGNIIQGILRDSFETKSRFARDDGQKKKRVYKVELTKEGSLYHPASVEGEDPPEAPEGELPVVKGDVGDLVGVDEKGFLKALKQISVGQEIWIAYRGKEAPSADYPLGRHVFSGPKAKPTKVNPVTGEVTS
jgi:hypothetical protein